MSMDERSPDPILGRRVESEKADRARELRRNMTPAERLLWNALRANQLDGLHFRRQQVIDGYIVDFYCHAAGLVVEVDGPIHDGQRAEDAERDQVLEAGGRRVLRVTNGQVDDDLPGVLRRISAAARDGATSAGG
jgi:very-short-patch-repair endonuclease